MKKIFQKIESNKVLLKNFTSLSLLQAANYIFPLITLPYLVRVLGPEKYGLVNFAAAFAAYFTIISDYGFNFSAVQEISVNRENTNRVSEIFSSVLTVKILLFILLSLIFFILVLVFPIFNENAVLFIVSFLSVLGTALFPLWFYQGIEQMKYISIIFISVRFVSTVLVFVIINTENDFIKYAGLNTATQFVIGIIGLWFAINKFELRYTFPSKLLIIQQFKNGWALFLSTVSINIYTTSNVFILGLFAPANVVGYFAAADKIRMAFQGLLAPVSQSVFPYVNKVLSKSYEQFIRFNKKLLKIVFAAGIIISLFMFLFAEPIVNIILGKEYQPSVLILKIIAWLPMIIFLSNVLGIQTMLPLNKQKSFAITLSFAALISLTLSFILVPVYFETGTAVTALVTETFVTIAFYIFVKRNKIFAI